ncbi:ATP-binding protein [Enhygromyxa salina]|uniref:Chaperone protein HtpG n=1 Tax=Enhygromyxa salina TaxID=215803 RepID=A0A2S9YUH3_9BACT|nr:ATP-binding protein [Enhygromyxa salina]PRQ08730.1 Chaperone protein HtpG [Enhygromyxa salina]
MAEHSTTLHKTRVDLEGLMKVLGDHLYSTPMVAVRELVQNAHDSCERRRIESGAGFEPRIIVLADPSAHTLTIEDTGAGLTDDEIRRYLATVGAGYTRTLRQREAEPEVGSNSLIGYFGLGFLSAFVVAERTEVWTCSYQQPELAWRFVSRDGQTYTLETGSPRPVGTRVTLHLREAHRALANPLAVRRLLIRYACLLRHPIFCPLDVSMVASGLGLAEGDAVNAEPPPWRDDRELAPLRRRKLALEFAGRFESDFEPLCTIPIGDASDQPEVRGLLWIQDATTYGSSDNRRVWVFVRGMMITDDARELLPRWAGFVGAAIEGLGLTPTASREDLQRDGAYDRAAAQLLDALVEGLGQIASEQPATWRRILYRHNEALLGAAICDARLFALIAEQATIPTSQGDLNLTRVLERSQGKIYVSQAQRGGFEELLFRALSVPVVQARRYGALAITRRWAEQRGVPLVMLGTERGEQALFRRVEDHELESGAAEGLRRAFAAEDGGEVEVVLSRFAPAHLPFVLVPDREVELKQRIEADDADRRISTAALGLARLFTQTIAAGPPVRLHLNLDCRVIAQLGERLGTPERATAAAGALGLLRPLVALLSQTDEQQRYMSSEAALTQICELAERLVASAP